MLKPLLLLSVSGLLLALALANRPSVSVPDPNVVRDGGLGAHLTAMSRTINVRLPEMIDSRVRLDATIGGPGPVFSYIYTLPAYRSSDISAAGVYAAFAPGLRRNFCTLPEMMPFVESGVSIFYVYRGRDGGQIARVFVTASDCIGLESAPVIFSA